ncbi:MAG TPA: hypothetical protein VHD60_04740 [Candidatus Saccharimonadales bacterium]|nr:hypothetical protein [Candidatus Saccharimonadales bacterium]
MDKVALRAVARLAHINVYDAYTVVRHNPLLGEEIHIEEELINLEELIKTYHMGGGSLNRYPSMKQHILREKRLVLKHCIGLIIRMLQGKRLPRSYTSVDIKHAIRRLVRLVIEDAQKAHIRLDDEVLHGVQPLLSWRQRYAYWDKPRLSLRLPIPTWLALPKLRA